MTVGPSVLLISTSWWPFTARIALRFARMGWRVEAACPAGHPLRATGAVARLHAYSALQPVAALQTAITAARADLIVPCDDRAVAHLHDLHARAGASTAEIIARSLGRPEHYAAVGQRSEMIRIAREEGLRAPETRAVGSVREVRAALRDLGLPLVLKVDGTSGGNGVRVAHTPAQAQAMYLELARPVSATTALKWLTVYRDAYSLLPWLTRAKPRVSAQRFVSGRPANSITACRDGEVLADTHAEVLHTHGDVGPACVVRVIAHPDMQATGEKLARRLGLSGFCGFDFIVEQATGHAYLIEVNPRSTPLCHLALGPGRDPVAALAARWEGMPPPLTAAVTDNPVIAFFPQARPLAATSPNLADSYHDVPWDDPGLTQELMRRPYPHRGILARLFTRQAAPGAQGPAAPAAAISLVKTVRRVATPMQKSKWKLS